MSDVSTHDQALIDAARYGHLDVVRYLVSQGANVHAREDEALIDAAWKGHLDTVKYLVSQGANARAQEDRALIYAALNGHLNVVRYLVSQGADVRTQADRALIYAVRYGYLNVVRYLVSQGVQISRTLINEALKGRSDVLSFLLDMYEDSGHLRSYPEVRDAMGKISRDRSIISSSLRAGTNIANLISTYY